MEYIYLFLYEKDTRKKLVIQFPIGYWETEKISRINPKKDNKKEFDLDEYLKQNKGNGIEIKKITKVGD